MHLPSLTVWLAQQQLDQRTLVDPQDRAGVGQSPLRASIRNGDSGVWYAMSCIAAWMASSLLLPRQV